MLNSFLGNNEIKNIIKNAVISGRFPHAFIIEGESGSGRKTLAKIIAAAAICKEQNSPCGNCRACSLIMRDSHSDVLTYTPDGATFKVDTVRDIRDNAYIVPIEANRKVNIITDCDKMADAAQNALLKILEEPPQFMVFILICKNASYLLPTVRSRCITLTLQNPDRNEALNWISKKCERSTEDISEALDLSHGNVGEALNYLSGQTAEAVEKAQQFISYLKKHDRLSALETIFSFEKNRIGFNAFLAELRLSLQSELKICVLQKSSFSPSVVSDVLSIIEKFEQRVRLHVGRPLSLSLLSTALCAEIFSVL